MFSSVRSYRKISKLQERSWRLCINGYNWGYEERLSKQGVVSKVFLFLLWMGYLYSEISHVSSEIQGISIVSC